ncbi:segregation and condensation protein A [Companilactobacillus baiquanensis]|uniref:Segregation and condensation protein A n=1 Tax=Companilactobacillus baiquanensis TaxID=2486005 RepID=A0ABW1UUH5_9LACO|nr:segregation/condensation protein A [Companilactobacillus baiquanensis]
MKKLNLVLTDFEGPIDLLLHLIRESKIDIYDIPIAQITQQYLDYLNKMKVLELDIAGDYLVMASTLMSIKSKMLLPKTPDEFEDDDLEMEDPRDQLVSQLLTYQTFKRVSEYFSEKEKIRRLSFDKDVSVSQMPVDKFLLPDSIALEDLRETYVDLLINQSNRQPQTEIIQNETLSIEDAEENILQKLTAVKKANFQSLLKLNNDIEEVVTNFMAILEMVKKKQVLAIQHGYQSDLFIELRN